ncbi:uncharacterized protein LOC131942331 [Physella acuta]|uniref:uncharacterized protein LOC131942331 n=1 Tax=Physella acuta TaxID=109671 RepID=UPI0027DBFEA5|nr:uncharacterized protein LOC131942331 [Physella acuta]
MASEDISKHFTGTYEVQELLEGQDELDLHTQQKNCQKNPGHVGFVPINKFSISDLPADYQDDDLYEFTKALAFRTVRIAVNFTSLLRPEFATYTKDPYPCYQYRGENNLCTGTGNMISVSKDMEYMGGYRTCPCPKCESSDNPSKVWWKILVATSKHVIFDDSEAKQSSCRLWFDDNNSPVFKIYGWKTDGLSSDLSDSSNVYFVTHEIEIFNKLKEMELTYNLLLLKLHQTYQTRDVNKMTIIVSHPHGCSKQVSVGNWVHRQAACIGFGELDNLGKYAYTNATCPGSSGAMIYRLGNLMNLYRHSGGSTSGLNFSGLFMG